MTPLPIKPALDRRSQRTRDALRDALVDLIAERGWDDITVQDVCNQANIGRSTFYSHYTGKDALLVGGFEDLQAELQRQARAKSALDGTQTGAAPRLGFVLGLIEHAHEQRKIFRGLIGRRSGYVVQQRFRDMVMRLVVNELPADAPDGLPREAAARCLSAAFVELLSWWVEQANPMSSTALEAQFIQLAQAVWHAQVADPHTSPASATATQTAVKRRESYKQTGL
ncbi:MAG: Transcriptional regulator [Comamonadaceae bacterium]|nr:MAG: Transcriptional regulator [Comamonadaceae bacterium]